MLLILFSLTELAAAGRFRGVEGHFKVGLCPLGQSLLLLFNTELTGLKTLQLETGVLPQSPEVRQRLSQHLLSVHTNADLKVEREKWKTVMITDEVKRLQINVEADVSPQPLGRSRWFCRYGGTARLRR